LLTKREEVRAAVARQFADRTVKKEYHALVHGVPEKERFEVDAPIDKEEGGDASMKRTVRPDGLPSKTEFRRLSSWGRWSLLSCEPLTGRTHQIRVHLAWAGFPILCDALYGRENFLTRKDLGAPGEEEAEALNRHALHARRLTIVHPVEDRELTFEAPYTKDVEGVLALLGGKD
jgi:RluA family pseudouridine synthase